MGDRYYPRTMLGKKNNSLMMILAIQAIVFCIFQFIYLAYLFSSPERTVAKIAYLDEVHKWFTLPSNLSLLLERPWTLFTYMFLHFEVWHLLGNLIWLWAFGFILHDLAGPKKLIPLFIYGGFAGGIFYILCYNLIPGFQNDVALSTLQGASAGVMAVAIATTVLAPGYRIFPMIHGGIPLYVLTIVFIIIDIASIGGDNAGGHLSHIGGAMMGYIFVHQLRRGRDWTEWMNRFFDWVANLFNPEKSKWQKTAKKEYHYKTGGSQPYKKIPNLTQKRIDEILDKIGEKGYHHLTDEEKQILKRAAEDDNL